MCSERAAEVDTERYRFGVPKAEGELHVDKDDPHEHCGKTQAPLWREIEKKRLTLTPPKQKMENIHILLVIG